MSKNYQELPLGFDRTQLYKEQVQYQITRSAAMAAVLDFATLNGIKMTLAEMMALVEKYILFIETGDKSWIKKVDEYFKERNEKLQIF
jgi:hypothetical protein